MFCYSFSIYRFEFAYLNLSMHIHVFGSIDVYQNVCGASISSTFFLFIHHARSFESLSRCMSISSFPTQRRDPTLPETNQQKHLPGSHAKRKLQDGALTN